MSICRWTRVEEGYALLLRRRNGDRPIILVGHDQALLRRIDALGPWKLRRDGVVVSYGGVTLRRLVCGVTDPRLIVRPRADADPLDHRREALEVVSRAEVALDTHRRARAGTLWGGR